MQEDCTRLDQTKQILTELGQQLTDTGSNILEI